MDALLRAVNGSPRFDLERVNVGGVKAQQAAQEQQLQALAAETGADIAVLRTFAAISDPANKRHFTAEAARQAFGKRKPLD